MTLLLSLNVPLHPLHHLPFCHGILTSCKFKSRLLEAANIYKTKPIQQRQHNRLELLSFRLVHRLWLHRDKITLGRCSGPPDQAKSLKPPDWVLHLFQRLWFAFDWTRFPIIISRKRRKPSGCWSEAINQSQKLGRPAKATQDSTLANKSNFFQD